MFQVKGMADVLIDGIKTHVDLEIASAPPEPEHDYQGEYLLEAVVIQGPGGRIDLTECFSEADMVELMKDDGDYPEIEAGIEWQRIAKFAVPLHGTTVRGWRTVLLPEGLTGKRLEKALQQQARRFEQPGAKDPVVIKGVDFVPGVRVPEDRPMILAADAVA